MSFPIHGEGARFGREMDLPSLKYPSRPSLHGDLSNPSDPCPSKHILHRRGRPEPCSEYLYFSDAVSEPR